MTPTRAVFVPLISAVLLLAACGESGNAGTAPQADAADAPTPTTSASEDGDSAAPIESPIAELFGVPVGDDDAFEDQIAEMQRTAERQIAECMQRQGFSYTPIDYSSLDGFDVALDGDDRAFAETHGFGIATSVGGELDDDFGEFVDPNQALLDELSEGERDAWYSALMGAPPTIEALDEENSAAFFEPGGCQGEAYETAFDQFAVFDEFADEFEALEQSFENDPRVVDARAEWASCMFDRGHAFDSTDDARRSILTRYQALVADEPGAPQFSDDGGDVMVFGDVELSPEVVAAVDALAEEERRLAVASWECEQPVDAVLDSVRVEYEQRFVDQHGDAVRAARNG